MNQIPDELFQEYQNNPIVCVALKSYVRGSISLEAALIACVKALAAENKGLFERCHKLMKIKLIETIALADGSQIEKGTVSPAVQERGLYTIEHDGQVVDLLPKEVEITHEPTTNKAVLPLGLH